MDFVQTFCSTNLISLKTVVLNYGNISLPCIARGQLFDNQFIDYENICFIYWNIQDKVNKKDRFCAQHDKKTQYVFMILRIPCILTILTFQNWPIYGFIITFPSFWNKITQSWNRKTYQMCFLLSACFQQYHMRRCF